MIVFTKINDIRTYLITFDSIGFVPTMGALHAGHLALIEKSKSENTCTVCSIFVNPIQFNNAADLEKYPRTLQQDIEKLESINCDVLFAPSVEEMYPTENSIQIDFGYQNLIMEGAKRRGHFSGVGVVVSKLFNIVKPSRAYFGQKDFQQCLIVKQLIEELAFPIRMQIVPTLREKDGLAMSSRNARLSELARNKAPKIFKLLCETADRLKGLPIELVTRESVAALQADADFEVEYLSVVEFDSGKLVNKIISDKKYAICIAVNVGGVRLIDNLIFES